jgi:hypothetical protein
MINLAVGLLVAGLVAVSLESGGVALVLFWPLRTVFEQARGAA